MNVGDTVRVTLRVKEGSRERNQVFEGTIIARKHGGINENHHCPPHFLRRRLREGFPRSFSEHREGRDRFAAGKVRRAKLYYLRNRLGRASKVKEKV